MNTLSNIVTEMLRYLNPGRISLTNFFGNFIFTGGTFSEADSDYTTSDKSFANNNNNNNNSNNKSSNQTSNQYHGSETESSLTPTTINTHRVNPITAASNIKRQLPQPINSSNKITSPLPNSYNANDESSLFLTSSDQSNKVSNNTNKFKREKSVNSNQGARSTHAFIREVKKKNDDTNTLTRFDSLTSTPPPLLNDSENGEKPSFLQSNNVPPRSQRSPTTLSSAAQFNNNSKQRLPSTKIDHDDSLSLNSQASSSHRPQNQKSQSRKSDKTNIYTTNDTNSNENISVFSKEKTFDSNFDNKKRLNSSNNSNNSNLDEKKIVHPRLRWLQAYHFIRQQLVS
jgi:hypothetical protein